MPQTRSDITPHLIAIDWGTSSLRCTLLGRNGAIIDRRDGGPGILAVEAGQFPTILAAETASWRAGYGTLPIILSGMVGSRQGWREVPYLSCPAGVAEVAEALVPQSVPGLGPIVIVPGLTCDAPGGTPDVMRGEETQIFGASTIDRGPGPMPGPGLGHYPGPGATFVLPGTHAKWATVRDGKITAFSTFMTGEVFAALRNHTILGRLMPAEPSSLQSAAFDRGVTVGSADGHPGLLLSRIFSARTLALFDRLAPDAIESYLSGLLIGAEIAANAPADMKSQAAPFVVVGNKALTERYERAAHCLGIPVTRAPEDAAARGAWRLATHAGMMKG